MQNTHTKYKNTELGLIPEDWEIKELGKNSFITKLAGFEYTLHFNSYKDKGEIIVIRGTNITHNKLDLKDIRTIPRKTSNFLLRSKLYKNDLVFAYVGTIGPIFLVEEDDRFHLGPNTSKITVNKELNSKFLFHYFTSSYLKKEIIEHTSIGAQPSLSMSKIRSFKIIVPPTLSEQTAIATALSDTDALIFSLEQLIAKKRAIKQGAMQELLRPKDGWEMKKLGEIVTFLKGKGLSKSSLNNDGKFKCIHYGELFTRYNEKITHIISRTDVGSNCIFSCTNDILMPTSDVTPNGLATASCIKENGIILGGDVLIIRPYRNTIDGIFFAYHIKRNRNQIMKLVSGSTVYHLYGSSLYNFEISYPQMEQQTRIATFLSDMDTEIENLENKLHKYKQIKQGMMQQLLTGKIRLI
ncbi:MAG: restriction endonuclease subunit S [Saprospiraceae bacterium]